MFPRECVYEYLILFTFDVLYNIFFRHKRNSNISTIFSDLHGNDQDCTVVEIQYLMRFKLNFVKDI